MKMQQRTAVIVSLLLIALFTLMLAASGCSGGGGGGGEGVAAAEPTNEAPTAQDDTFSLAEDAVNTASVGTVTASDPDAGDTLTCSIIAGNTAGVFAINASTGEITVFDNTNLDYETTTSYSLTVQVQDTGALTDTATITVNVTDVPEFQVVQYFPLTSSWETDNWTLFIDERQHDVNGTMTKAMVDTNYPTLPGDIWNKVFYWTCDDDGLRLHRHIDQGDGPIDFSPPILIAAAVAKVGDRWEGTYTVKTEAGIDLGQIKLTSEIVGIEDISVPAGDFADCIKLEIAGLDPTDDSLKWKETWWMAEGVGLVKIVNYSDSEDEGVLAGNGETRQLLSYHITPSDLTDDEKAIKQLRANFSDYWEQENLAAIDNLYSNSWSSRCRDKTARMQEFADSFAANENIANFASISDIVINGDEAKCTVQRLSVGIGDDGSGSEWASWNRSSSHMIKEGGEWKYYGSQVDFKINWMNVWTRKGHDESEILVLGGSFNDCSDNPIEVDSFSVTGPPGTFTDLNLIPEWDGGYYDEYFLRADIADATDGFYTYTVGDVSGNTLQSTDYLEVLPLMDIQNLDSATVGGAAEPYNVTLKWYPVAEAHYYRVALQRDTGGGNWVYTDRALPDGSEIQWVFYNLTSATDYRWTVRARQDDSYGNMDNESRSDWAYFSTP